MESVRIVAGICLSWGVVVGCFGIFFVSRV
jgi:hypothetical protein